ncbi:MAG TPA: hypothetical protein VKA64_08620 [Gammaproteobacteria bacterium]|nr:hypothetical protein [Gammaproteobacteria bacterium]
MAVVDEMCIYCDQPIKAGQPAGSAAHAECEQQEAEFSEAMARELTQPCSWMTAVRAAQAYRELWHEAAAGLVDRQHRLARSIITEAAAELDRLAEELRQSHTTPDGEWPTEEIDHAQTEYVRLRYLADGLRGVQARLDQQVLAVLWQGE